MGEFAQQPKVSKESSPSPVRAPHATVSNRHADDERPRVPVASRDLYTPVHTPVRIQAKLTIGGPGDSHEREADRIADAVMRVTEPKDSNTRFSHGVVEKSRDGEEGGNGVIQEKAPPDAGVAAPGPGAAAPKKKAGVSSFSVKWTKHSTAGATTAKLHLEYSATFKKDAAHDPALADFRQSVFTKYEVTDGPHKGTKGDTSPLHDDNYSRADDSGGNAMASKKFKSNDNPGFSMTLHKDDVLDYSFTAQQTIIDTSDGNKVLATKGPHTGTIKGKHPRAYTGVPKTL